jgi:transposase-like protein
MGLKQKYCPDCKVHPVSYVPGESITKDYYYCTNCREKFSVDFRGFVERPVKPRKAYFAAAYLSSQQERRAYDAYVR